MSNINLNVNYSSKKGLSLVVTTLIILVFSSLLALTLIIYTNGLTRARMRSTGQEDVRFHKEHTWVYSYGNGTDRAEVAFKLHNLGGKSVAIQVIDVRGTEIDWSKVYYHLVNRTSEPALLYSDINYFNWTNLSGDNATIDGYTYFQAKGSIWVDANQYLIIYIKAPEIMFKDNIGTPAMLAVATTNANYVTEVVIESVS
jgi:hypothetical protein